MSKSLFKLRQAARIAAGYATVPFIILFIILFEWSWAILPIVAALFAGWCVAK